jgi:proline iminopeptidase
MRAHVNGTDLYYETVGQGPPMLVMHGGLGLDHTYFRPWLDQLGDTVQVIYYDHRGNGRSERPADWSGVSHETWAADADALREHLGHEQIVLFGHSYGGFLAMEYATRYGDRLRGLVLSCTTPCMDYPEVIIGNAASRSSQEVADELVAGLTNLSDKDEDMASLIGTIMPLYFHRPDPDVMAQLGDDTVFSGPAYAHSFGQCIPAYDMRGKLGSISAPTLVLSGGDDWITPTSHGAERIVPEIPGAQFVEFEKSGHFPFAEETERFMQVMREWLKGLG